MDEYLLINVTKGEMVKLTQVQLDAILKPVPEIEEAKSVPLNRPPTPWSDYQTTGIWYVIESGLEEVGCKQKPYWSCTLEYLELDTLDIVELEMYLEDAYAPTEFNLVGDNTLGEIYEYIQKEVFHNGPTC